MARVVSASHEHTFMHTHAASFTAHTSQPALRTNPQTHTHCQATTDAISLSFAGRHGCHARPARDEELSTTPVRFGPLAQAPASDAIGPFGRMDGALRKDVEARRGNTVLWKHIRFP